MTQKETKFILSVRLK